MKPCPMPSKLVDVVGARSAAAAPVAAAGTLHDRIRLVRQHTGRWNAADRLCFQVPEVPRSGRHLPQRRRDVMMAWKE